MTFSGDSRAYSCSRYGGKTWVVETWYLSHSQHKSDHNLVFASFQRCVSFRLWRGYFSFRWQYSHGYFQLYFQWASKIYSAREKETFPWWPIHHVFFNTERVIVTDTRKNPQTITTTNLAFAGAAKSNISFLIEEKKQLERTWQIQDNR